jgi:hypothetical protein
MSDELDDGFTDRADAHIRLSNEQLESIGSGKVSASMMYATARFNAWLSATTVSSAEDMRAVRPKTVAFLLSEYGRMLNEHLDDYIENFDAYMKRKA